MWFRNAYILQLLEPIQLDITQLEARLSSKQSRQIGSTEQRSVGFAPPLPDMPTSLALVTDNSCLLCIHTQEKLLPASIVRTELQRKIAMLEQKENRKVYKREQREIRDAILNELLDKAFIKQQYTYVIIDNSSSTVMLDAVSKNKTETALHLLHAVLPNLQLQLPEMQTTTVGIMTKWLEQATAPWPFNLEDQAELIDFNNKNSIVRLTGQDLASAACKQLLQEGKCVQKLAITYADKLTCILGRDVVLRRIHYLQNLKTDASKDKKDQHDLIADYLLFLDIMRNLWHDLLQVFIVNNAADTVQSQPSMGQEIAR